MKTNNLFSFTILIVFILNGYMFGQHAYCVEDNHCPPGYNSGNYELSGYACTTGDLKYFL